MYLAYILSSSYAVDQVIYKVDGVSGDETVASFLSKVTPVTGANAKVVDKNGMDKTSGSIDKDDIVSRFTIQLVQLFATSMFKTALKEFR